MVAQVAEDLPGGIGQVEREPMVVSSSVADRGIGGKGPTTCARCKRRLTDPHSIARNLGPVCYRAAGGGAWDKDMQASEAEWERRAQDLRKGGEWDFGYWNYVFQAPGGPVVLPRAMRVSVRYQGGQYEAYGEVDSIAHAVQAEVVFYRGGDLKAAWRAAIAAGPESNAAAYRVERQIARAWKAQLRGGGRRGERR